MLEIFNKFKKKKVYFDHAATTPLDREVFLAMKPFLENNFYNAGAIYEYGNRNRLVLDNSREKAAKVLGVRKEEVIFTSGGTESNNLAIKGSIENLKKAKNLDYQKIHIITTPYEHASVREVMNYYRAKGAEVSEVEVFGSGSVRVQDVIKLVRENTCLVSIMHVNNEIGAVNPINRIAKEIKKINQNIIFHTDSSQAPLYFDTNPRHLEVDLMTLDGHKMYGPKGVGLLFRHHSLSLEPELLGGGQEYGFRSTTVDLASIVGLTKTLEITQDKNKKEESIKKVKELKRYFLENLEKLKNHKIIKEKNIEIILNSSIEKDEGSPAIINFSTKNINSEFLVLQLDEAGYMTSTKSTCLKDQKSSYVIDSLIKEEDKKKEGWRRESSIRVSLGKANNTREIKGFFEALTNILVV